MYIPTFYEGLVKWIPAKDDHTVIMHLSNDHNGDLYDIYYYGDIMEDYGLIVETDESYNLIIAKSVKSGQEIVLFDGAWDLGYDYLLWQSHDEELLANLSNRKLKKLDAQAVKVMIEAEYSIDYEEEKDNHDFVDENHVLSGHEPGKPIPWDEVKKNGISGICITLIDGKGNERRITEYELS
ncbi:MAG: hypothetical protein LBH09_06615 [Peptococcaceae bacterium]|jgi:hypothetical protein|nr:hypothetical protein [Peptococcaceae bacterium]